MRKRQGQPLLVRLAFGLDRGSNFFRELAHLLLRSLDRERRSLVHERTELRKRRKHFVAAQRTSFGFEDRKKRGIQSRATLRCPHHCQVDQPAIQKARELSRWHPRPWGRVIRFGRYDVKEKLQAAGGRKAALFDVPHPIASERSISEKTEQRLDDWMPRREIVDLLPLNRRVSPKGTQHDFVLRER